MGEGPLLAMAMTSLSMAALACTSQKPCFCILHEPHPEV